MKVGNFCFIVAFLPLVLCLREMNIGMSLDLNLSYGKTSRSSEKSVAAACKDVAILTDSCARLKMNDGASSVIPGISLQEVADYFLVEATDLDNFAAAMGLRSSSSLVFGCDALCAKSVEYLQHGRGWLIPPESGQICTHWHNHSCMALEPASFTFMGKLAEAMDISGANNMDDREPVVEKKEELSKNVGNSNGTPDMRYSPLQLALAVANLFQVFPSPPLSSASLLEGKPPDFGDEVTIDDRSHWQEIVPLSESWIGSALSEVPRNLHLVKIIMGRDDNSTIREIRKILLGMQRTLGEVKIRTGEATLCQTHSDMLAYVTQFTEVDGTFRHGEQDGERYVIRVCPQFMGEDFIEDPTYRYGTLVHEASHHWGTKDEEFQGHSPYGLMQSLFMAKENPVKASRNADNFMWLVYFLNLCSSEENVVVPTTDTEGPCKLQLKHEDNKVKVRIQCTAQARGVTLNLMDKDRVYLSGEKNFGTLQADDVTKGEWSPLGSFSLAVGTRVHVFYESGCNIWEALAIVEKKPTTAHAVKPVTPSKMLHSLADARRDPNRLPESGIWLPVDIGAEVDVPLHFGIVSDVLTFSGKEYKCCKRHDATEANKLVDVTTMESSKRGCGDLGGSGWHSYNNKVFTFFYSAIFDGTCKVSFEEFKNKTVAVRKASGKFKAPLPQISLHTAVVTGVPFSFEITDATCHSSVPGAKRRIDKSAISGTAFHFFSEMACACDEGNYVAGQDVHCTASVEHLRFFNSVALVGRGCECQELYSDSDLREVVRVPPDFLQ